MMVWIKFYCKGEIMNKTIIAFMLLVLTVCTFPIFAWWTQMHSDLARITYIQDNTISQYHAGFLFGSIEPDSIRDLKPWLNSSHQNDAPERAFNSLGVAVREYKNGNYMMASRRVGRAVHYIQDAADPTKLVDDWLHKQYGEDVRYMAVDICNEVLYDCNLGTRNSYFWKYYGDAHARFKNYDEVQLTKALRFCQQRIATAMRNSFIAYKNNRIYHYEMVRQLKDYIRQSFAIIVSAQNRVITMFTKLKNNNNPNNPNIKKLTDIVVKQQQVTIKVWDHGCEDGDVISLLLNGQTIFRNLRISKKGNSANVYLPLGQNRLRVIAVDSGTDCPPKSNKAQTVNSAAISISNASKGGRQSWSLRQGDVSDANIVVGAHY